MPTRSCRAFSLRRPLLPMLQDKFHGATEAFYVWVEDGDSENVYHSESFLLKK